MKISSNSIIQKLLPEFIESGINDFAIIVPDLIIKKDKSELYRYAHSWKGAAAQYEFPELSDKCKALLSAATSEDWSKADTLTTSILTDILEIQSVFTQKKKLTKDFYFN